MAEIDKQDPVFPEDEGGELSVSRETQLMQSKYRHTFGHSLGREVLMDLMKMCFIGDQNYSDDNLTQLQKAEYQNLGIAILQKCGMNRDEILKSIIYNMKA